MTPEERIIHLISEDLIERHGAEFLNLSEKDKMLIICDELRKHIDNLKNGE